MVAMEKTQQDPVTMMEGMTARARAAARRLAASTGAQRDQALQTMAARIRADLPAILAANARDLEAAREAGVTGAFLDRLTLDAARVEGMAEGLETVARLPDPLGAEIARWTRPNGLDIARVRTPLGVIGIIYESRPNVTADAGALCLKAGNAAILRGGSESFHSSQAIAAAMAAGLEAAGLPADAIQLVPSRDRALVGAMLAAHGGIDVIVPRGGKSLIARVQAESRVPVLAHLEGLCHVYLHRSAEPEMAQAIVLNAKMRRPGVCGAAETLLVDRAAAPALLPAIIEDRKSVV